MFDFLFLWNFSLLTFYCIFLQSLTMRIEVSFVLVLAACSVLCEGDEEKKKEKVKKLQIGVKKRVDNCTLKSRRGDLLHMHYTVSIFETVIGI